MSADLIPQGFARTGLHITPNGVVPSRFQVLGERSSGTNYVKRLLGRNTGLRPTEGLGWKHGFPQPLAIPDDFLVVVAVRGAGAWARSMHAKPWHTPPAMQAMGFSDFIRAPWETVIDRPKYFEGIDARSVGMPLQQDRHPLTGAVFGTLFALRQAKLAGHLSYAARGCAFVLLRMEEAIAAPEAVLSQICEGLSLPAPSSPFRPVVKRLGSNFKAAVEARPATPKALSEEDLAFLRAQVDPEQEAALGYAY